MTSLMRGSLRLGRLLQRASSHSPTSTRTPGGSALLQSFQRLAWSKSETEKLLQRCQGDATKLTPELTRLSKQGKVAPVIHLLRCLPSEGIQITKEHIQLALQTCSTAKDSLSAFNFVMELEDKIVDTAIYKALLIICSECNDAESASSTLSTMRKRGLPIDVLHWNCYLNALAEQKDVQSVAQSILDMRLDGVVANIGSYNILLKACSRALDFHQAMTYFARLPELDLQPDKYTWSQIVQVATSTGHLEEARRLIHDMLEKKRSYHLLTPFVFNHVLKAQAAANDMTSIDELFKLMRSYSVRPDIVSYQYALTVAARLDDKPKVKSLFQQLLQEGAKLNSACWKIAVTPFSRGLDVESVLELIDTVRSNFQQVEAFMWRDVIIIYGRQGRTTAAEQVLEEMKVKDKLDSTAECFQSVVRSYTDHGDWYRGLSVLRHMRQRGFTPAADLWMLIITAHGGSWNSQSLTRLFEFLQEMMDKDSRLPSQISLQQLFTSLHKGESTVVNDVDHLLFVGFLRRIECSFQESMTERIIDALLHVGEVELTYSILSTMGVENNKLWNSLLSTALLRRNKFGVDSCLRQQGFILESNAAQELIHYYLDIKEYNAAVSLVDTFLCSKTLELNTQLFNSFLLIFLKIGDWHRFQEILNTMHRSKIAYDESTYRMWIQMTITSSNDVKQGLRLVDAM